MLGGTAMTQEMYELLLALLPPAEQAQKAREQLRMTAELLRLNNMLLTAQFGVSEEGDK